MKKKKIKKVRKKFKYIKEERRNVLFNFRNNFKIRGAYLSIRYIDFLAGSKRRFEDCLTLPVRYRKNFKIGDLVLFEQRKVKSYFKITDVNEQEIWEGPYYPHFALYLATKTLNNLEFLAAMNDLKKILKNR